VSAGLDKGRNSTRSTSCTQYITPYFPILTWIWTFLIRLSLKQYLLGLMCNREGVNLGASSCVEFDLGYLSKVLLMRRNNLNAQVISLCCLLMLTCGVQAVEISGLYDAQVAVVDREAQTFRGATQDALAEVIVRVSGDSRAIESVDVIAALSKPDRYLLQFDYQKLATKIVAHNALVADIVQPTMEPDPTLLLNLQFDNKAINQLLRRAGLPIWASNRPEVLLWLGAELSGQRQLVSPSSAEVLNRVLEKESARRGLPLSMPLYDLEDQAIVSIGDIWGLFTDRLISASTRYPAAGILMAKIYQNNDGQWVGSWVLSVDEKSQWFDIQGANPDEVIAQAVDWAADNLAAQFAVLASADDADAVTLRISGIHQLGAYARVAEYLESVVAIRQVQIQEIQGDKLTFQVYLESDKEQLQQALKLDGHLQFLENNDIFVDPVFVAQPTPSRTINSEELLPVPVVANGEVSKTMPVLFYRWKG